MAVAAPHRYHSSAQASSGPAAGPRRTLCLQDTGAQTSSCAHRRLPAMARASGLCMSHSLHAPSAAHPRLRDRRATSRRMAVEASCREMSSALVVSAGSLMQLAALLRCHTARLHTALRRWTPGCSKSQACTGHCTQPSVAPLDCQAVQHRTDYVGRHCTSDREGTRWRGLTRNNGR